MSKPTIVLGGGGVTGIAWLLGILVGLKRAGVPLAAERVIGTSAGSVVGALFASGADLEAIAEQQVAGIDNHPPIVADMPSVMAAFMVLFDPSKSPTEARAIVGKMALDATNVGDEDSYIARFAGWFAALPWPTAPTLDVTVVEAETGEPGLWNATMGISLLHAISASCAVPMIFPPVTIGGKRYMDGGIRSAINADLAAGAKRVLVVAPMLAFSPRWPKEKAALGDADVVVVGPDAAATDAIGQNFMDASRRAPSFHAGLAQAATLVEDARRLFG